jgi:hypothetical protein
MARKPRLRPRRATPTPTGGTLPPQCPAGPGCGITRAHDLRRQGPLLARLEPLGRSP